MSPVPAATVMPVTAAGGSVEVLMIERPERAPFGGIHVFPGGKVDREDGGAEASRAVTGIPAAEELPWRAAALRELAEEVSLLVTDPPLFRLPELESGAFRAVLAAGARFDASRLVHVSTWVTPVGAPFRFETRFYLLALEERTEPVRALEEVVGAEWITPEEALARGRSGAWPMIRPTIAHLELLAGHDSIEALLACLPPPGAYSRSEARLSEGAARVVRGVPQGEAG